MTPTTWMRSAALVFLALAIVANGFAVAVPHTLMAYFTAAGTVFTALAALFTHPPGSLGETTPNPNPNPNPGVQ